MCKKPVNQKIKLGQHSFLEASASHQTTPRGPQPGSLRDKQRSKKTKTEKVQDQQRPGRTVKVTERFTLDLRSRARKQIKHKNPTPRHTSPSKDRQYTETTSAKFHALQLTNIDHSIQRKKTKNTRLSLSNNAFDSRCHRTGFDKAAVKSKIKQMSTTLQGTGSSKPFKVGSIPLTNIGLANYKNLHRGPPIDFE